MAQNFFSASQLRSFESTSQTVGRLRAGGFVAFEVDGVIARFAGKGAKAPDANMRRRLAPVLVLGAVYLAHAKRRLLQGRTATHPEPWQVRPQTGKKGYFVGRAYASLFGGDKAVSTAGGVPRFASSAAFHQGAKGPGVVTGGLLKSLQATTSGHDSVLLAAQGQSIGSSTHFVSIAAGAEGNKRGKAAKIKARGFVRNQTKLNSVWKHLRVNMLQPEDDEVQAMASAAGLGLARDAINALQIGGERNKIEGQLRAGADPALYRALVARWVR